MELYRLIYQIQKPLELLELLKIQKNYTWLTIKEVSSIYKFKLSTLYLWVEQGTIPHYRVGRLIRFKREEVAEWLDTGKREVEPNIKKMTSRIRSTGSMDINEIIRNSVDGAKGSKVQ